MRKVYETASNGLISLGPVDDGAARTRTLSWDLMRRLLPAKKAQTARNDKRLFYQMKVNAWKEYDLQVNDEAYSAFGKMLDCPWFTRVWNIQELAVSKKAVVQ